MQYVKSSKRVYIFLYDIFPFDTFNYLNLQNCFFFFDNTLDDRKLLCQTNFLSSLENGNSIPQVSVAPLARFNFKRRIQLLQSEQNFGNLRLIPAKRKVAKDCEKNLNP